MATKRKRPPSAPNHGLYFSNFPMSVRDKVECDYLHKLSPKDKAWLARANDAIAGADTSAMKALRIPLATRRQLYGEKNSANRDLFANIKGRDLLYPIFEDAYDGVENEDTDHNPTPAYLESSEYRQALQEYRAAIDAKDPRSRSAAEEKMRRIRLGWGTGR